MYNEHRIGAALPIGELGEKKKKKKVRALAGSGAAYRSDDGFNATGTAGDMSPSEGKKKVRSLGSFPCPDCSKVFTRSDHLLRHHLNHAPKQVFECTYVVGEAGGQRCGRTFVRKDLRDRHTKRHAEVDPAKRRRLVDASESPRPPLQPPPPPPQASQPVAPTAAALPATSPPFQAVPSQNDILSWLFSDTTVLAPQGPGGPGLALALAPLVPPNGLGPPVAPLYPLSLLVELGPPQPPPQRYDQPLGNLFTTDNPLDEFFLRATPPDFGRLDFTVSSSPATTDTYATPRAAAEEHSLAGAIRDHAHWAATAAPLARCGVHVDATLLGQCLAAVEVPRDAVEAMFAPLPPLEHRFAYYLSLYWDCFHARFSILHRPTFHAAECHPLLLLCMVLVGCSYADAAAPPPRSAEFRFGCAVAKPLRFALFEDPDFRTPVQPWILQSLNMLEWCEKNFLTRALHERAHIHHGTTVQLLRRLPLLGGNPAAARKRASASSAEDLDNPEVVASATDTDHDLFLRWVDAELMKRVTFMTCFLDIADYVKFRHNPHVMFYQLQLLNLPCDEALWESDDVVGSFKKVVKRQRRLLGRDRLPIRPGESFLSALRKLIRPAAAAAHAAAPPRRLSHFTQSILLGGLVLIMYQMQQADLQASSSLLAPARPRDGAWRQSLARALDRWSCEVCTGDRAMYRLTHVIAMGDLNHYDIAIYGGSPANMSVDATTSDHVVVQAKMNRVWAAGGLEGVVHAYGLLWEVLQPEALLAAWRAYPDYHDALYAVAIATLTVWSYVFSTYGPELSAFDPRLVGCEAYPQLAPYAAEAGPAYLVRVRRALTANHDALARLANAHHVSGLCFWVGTTLLGSPWEILRENARLILNCGLRSIGKPTVLCANLFASYS